MMNELSVGIKFAWVVIDTAGVKRCLDGCGYGRA
jgi:hypothetical protein